MRSCTLHSPLLQGSPGGLLLRWPPPGLGRSIPPPRSGPQSPSLTRPTGSCTSKAQPGHVEDVKLGHLNARKDPRTTRSDSQCPNRVKYDETGNPAPCREATRVKGLLPSPFCLSSRSWTCPARGGHAGFQQRLCCLHPHTPHPGRSVSCWALLSLGKDPAPWPLTLPSTNEANVAHLHGLLGCPGGP